jgi:hypothetical protein
LTNNGLGNILADSIQNIHLVTLMATSFFKRTFFKTKTKDALRAELNF